MTGKPYRPPKAKKPPKTVTEVHKLQPGFLSQMDKRSVLVRRLRQNYTTILQDLGGASEVSHVKNALAERFVFLESLLSTIEAELANGEINRDEALSRWIQAVNSLTGLAKALGLDRKQKDGNWSTVLAGDADGQ